jgi:hypothetical protein
MARLPRFMAIKYNCFAPSKESRPSQSPGNRMNDRHGYGSLLALIRRVPVMAGLDPAIPLRRAQCLHKRGHIGSRACPTSALLRAASRVNPTCSVKPGDDKLKMLRSRDPSHRSNFSNSQAPSPVFFAKRAPGTPVFRPRDAGLVVPLDRSRGWSTERRTSLSVLPHPLLKDAGASRRSISGVLPAPGRAF